MSKKPSFRLNKKTIIIAIVVVVALGILYYVNARNGGDNSALTSSLIGAVMGDDAAQGLQEIVQDVSGTNSNQQSSNEAGDTAQDGDLSNADSVDLHEVEPTDKPAEPTEKPAEPTKEPTKAPTSTPVPTPTEVPVATVSYRFRNNNLLTQHYEKHGIEMGFKSKEDYEKAASDVINNPDALHKTEKEDGDYVYYVEATNEFVILSIDGYIRTYFLPNAGLAYYNRQ